MRKGKITKLFAMTLACTLMIGSTMTTHALDYAGGDAAARARGREAQANAQPGSRKDRSSGSSSSSSSGSTGGSSSSGSSGSSSNNSGGNQSSGSNYQAPAADSGYVYVEEEAGDNGGNGVASVPTGLEYVGFTTAVPGYEKSRHDVYAPAGYYGIYHMGDLKAVFQAVDAEGNPAVCQDAKLTQLEDGTWVIDFTSAAAAGVSTTKGDANYIAKLGISGVSVNGTVVIEAKADAQ